MSNLESIKQASIYQKVVLVLLLISVTFAWTSFVTASWGDAYITAGSPDTLSGYGLWRRCGDSELAPGCTNLLGWNLDWYRAVQAFAIIGFVSVNISLFLVILLIFVPKCSKGKTVTLWISALSFLSALAYTLAVIIFAVGFDSTFEVTGSDDASLEYGCVLAFWVLLLNVVAGVLAIIEARSIGAKFLDL